MDGLVDVKIKLLNSVAKCPSQNNATDAGFDVYSCDEGIVYVKDRKIISLGFAMEMPDGYYAKLFSRSGLALKKGIIVLGGVVDSDYRGEVKAILYNSGDDIFEYTYGDKVAQMVFAKLPFIDITVVDTLSETSRGEKGFGSSGK
jgi:dUTP pyrophosphatase